MKKKEKIWLRHIKKNKELRLWGEESTIWKLGLKKDYELDKNIKENLKFKL